MSLSRSLLCRALVGRAEDLALLRTAWEDAGRGTGKAVFVSGVAGVGKSRLVREFVSWARSSGSTVLVGRATATSVDAPMRPFREALLAFARGGRRPGGRDIDAFVPALARLVPEWGAAGAESEPVVLAEGLLRLLEHESGDPREKKAAVLIVEDLQWADRETVAVVEYLADNLERTHALVIATLRDDEPARGRDAAVALCARRAAVELKLAPLNAAGVDEMLRCCLDTSAPPDELVRSLVSRSEGLPFLVEELLAAAIDAGTLSNDERGWSAGEDVETTVPTSVASSVEIRLGHLPGELARMLRAAALLGRQFDWQVAADAAKCSREHAPELYRRAVQAQLLEVDGAGFRFRHALTRDALLTTTLPAERMALAARAYDALRAFDPALTGEHCELAARLAADAGDLGAATGLLIEASRRALADGSLDSAEALAERARTGSDSGSRDLIDALLLEIWAHTGRAEEVEEAGRALMRSLSSKGAAPGRLADVALVMARAALAAGDYDTVDAHVGSVLELASDDSATRARAAALEAQAAMGRDDAARALPLARDALDLAEAAGLPEVRCEALEVIGRAERVRNVQAAESAFDEAYAVAVDHTLPVWRIRALQELGTIDMFETLATSRLERAREEALGAGALSIGAVIDLQLAATYNERGELERALDAARRCEDTSRRLGLATLPMSLVQQAFAHARAARRDDMERAIDAAVATREDAYNVEISVAGNGRALYHLARGDLPSAKMELGSAMDALGALPGAAFPFPGLWALVCTVLDESGDEARDRVRALAADTPVSREVLLAADAVASGRGGDKKHAVETFEVADAALGRYEGHFRQHLVRLLAAPCAAADGWADPVPWLRASLAAFERMLLQSFADLCRARLRDLGANVPRRSTHEQALPPELAELGITPRELTVLRLLGNGATNRSIAEELFLSPRTVEKHVERLAAKASTSRAGLIDLARRSGVSGV